MKSSPRLYLPLLATLLLGLGGATADAKLMVLFDPPTDERVDNSRGGASRPTETKCSHDDAYGVPLTALIPESGLGLTVAPHPTLLVYVPPTTAPQAHLTLRDENQRGLYQSRIPIPQTGGVLQIALPADSPELAVGQTYHWSLALLCQPTQTDLPIARGQIRRVELSETLSEALTEEPSLFSQSAVYGRSGVWHDMLATLVNLRHTQPENSILENNWAEVLQAENLGAIANMPLLNDESNDE
ncbi:DUF928 domain-containing protein [Leptolyngbya cf. ectocarpi LEGE 11479]|uniref:DUF928 domain-containing protein n=1 Tax=Leptolyngbya cf. ectocarpi LEGE 11479 TaxID=1828722 RepID=A0A928ZVK8_LEPEC|nr:DUF928 domain-containing protein [Leptolyngbya ectocarpi]MBE9068264.1 DUF928 domain-containing protein [Leptolyngbya cf. ectocarpi LEGE 11479]